MSKVGRGWRWWSAGKSIVDRGNSVLDGFEARRSQACSKNFNMNVTLTSFHFLEIYSHYFNSVNLAPDDF